LSRLPSELSVRMGAQSMTNAVRSGEMMREDAAIRLALGAIDSVLAASPAGDD